MSENEHRPEDEPGPESRPGPGTEPRLANGPDPGDKAQPVPDPGPATASKAATEAATGSEAATEPDAVSETAPASEAATEPAPVAGAPVRKPVRRGRIAAIVGAVLVAGAVVAGTGYTVVTVRDADRNPGAPVWAIPEDSGRNAKPAAPTGLAAALVPHGHGWERGPDLGEFASGVQLDGERAVALRKEALRGLPRTQRKRLEREIDKQRVRGMAMGSYLRTDVGDAFTEEAISVSVVLTRMDNKEALRSVAAWQNEFLEALHVFRRGPAVKGHKDAKCFLPPENDRQKKAERLSGMICSAHQGDVLVSLSAEGPAGFDTKAVADLLTDQLDRIKDPGEAV
ncbi:hypothetical protein [Streptomyces sp. NPDC003374]